MLDGLKTLVRRRVRGFQRAGHYPVLLPHHRLTAGGVVSPGQGGAGGDGAPRERALPPRWAQALALCDGTRKASDVARRSGVSAADLIAMHDQGLIVLWRGPVPPAPPKLEHQPHAILLSPHPDDAALSCGGRMLGDCSCLVVNVFSKTSWWRFAPAPDNLPEVQATRRAEEELVSRLAGVPVLNLDLPEALLRGHAMDSVFSAEADDRDADAIAAVAAAVDRLQKEHPLAHWFLPHGWGNHIDHRIVRDAALERLLGKVRDSHLHLYEDLPYAMPGKGAPPDFGRRHPNRMLTQEKLDIEEQIDWKLELLRAYWSQFPWSRIAELKPHARSYGDPDVAEAVWTLGRGPMPAASTQLPGG